MGKRESTIKRSNTTTSSPDRKVRFVVYGVEMLEKPVNPCGKSGRIYLPSGWIGRKVKVVRMS
jgi:putative transposon-encoded protein